MALLRTVCLLLGLVACPVQAGLITYNGYTLDEDTDIVTGVVLEWLQWDVTDGQSIGDALATHGAAGWRLATNQEMAALFNAFSFGLTFDTDESTHQVARTAWAAGESSPHIDFVTLFGNTYTEFVDDDLSDPLLYAAALFGSSSDAGPGYNLARVFDDFQYLSGLIRGGAAMLTGDTFPADTADRAFGVALVRPISAPEPEPDPFTTPPQPQLLQVNALVAVAVPEPATLAIVTLGLAGVCLSRRRQRRWLS